MRRTNLLLLASLAFASLMSLAEVKPAPLKLMAAPNLLRVGTAENIFVECQDCDGGDISVDIKVMNHPTKTKELAKTTVTLSNNNNFQQLGEITIPPGDFSRDPTVKQYVYLQAKFPDRELEKVVLVSFQSGYIFIQTDKTLYTPNSKVYYRMFGLTPEMKPVEGQNQADASIDIQIQTPDGIILPLDPVSLTDGIHSGDYQLSEIVSPGLWKVMARFQSNPQQSFSAEFEVKEYVLPSFEVKLLPDTPFFYVDSDDFRVSIKATYLFGREVYGTAYVVFGVLEDGVKRGLPSSLSRVPITNGEGQVTLKRSHLTDTFPEIHTLVGKSLYVAVSVLTEGGSEMVEAQLRGIEIVTSPYKITFLKTPKYFKPGMSFDVVVEVVNPDGSPANNVVVEVVRHNVQGLTAPNGVARLTINTQGTDTSLEIIARTKAPNLPDERQASANMVATPYSSNTQRYIHIGVDTAEVKVGDNLKINLNLNNQPGHQTDITYLITSRGRLVKSSRYKTKGQSLISLILPVTKELLPSFRIIAFYHPADNEVVSDSLWVDVKDSCMGSLTLQSTRPVPSYEPRKMFNLKITGDPGATVGLVAVDKGVYVLNNKHRLTQKKVWDIVEKYDTGCTPGGGSNSMNVFFDAGLLFESSISLGTPYRQELKCKTTARRKRATTILSVRTNLMSKYNNERQRECCLDGMKEIPLSYTCKRRAEYILDDPDCAEAFVHCCNEMQTKRAENKEDELRLARSESDDSYMDSQEIVSRTNFPESWLWSDIKLPACPRPNCESTSFVKNVPLVDSITTWQFTGISLSRTLGICIGDPLEVIVRKEFFIDLRLPYSAVHGEQLEIKAVLHNYSPDVITVKVDLLEEEHVCSSASKRGKYSRIVKVGAQATQSVSFIIIPMKEGQRSIEVKASVKDSSLNDGVRKMLRVVPQGVLVQTSQDVTLNPTEHGQNGQQVEKLNSNIPRNDLVPNAPTRTDISVTGREQVSGLVENVLSGSSLGTLIKAPGGCGEQTMISMTLPVIATLYLDKTNQWETVGFQRRNEAIQHIKNGYRHELIYRKTDGSFAVWAHDKSSSWLTAYVAKVFAMANTLVAVESEHICGAVKYLIINAQQPDGMFREIGRVYHGEMIGDVRGKDSDASMTAFCLIAMQEARTVCTQHVTSLQSQIDKAISYLEKHLPTLTNPYAVAMTSYALANENKLNREILFKFASPELNHWPVPGNKIFALEATAYALLALVKSEAFEDARPVVRWFNQQQFVGGGYGSTQATIMVYQALAEYWSKANEPEYNLNVDILLPGRTKYDKFNFNRENQFTTRTSKFNDINQDVNVIATGSGEATVKIVSLYYALPKEKESDCQQFNMSVDLIPEKITDDERTYRLRIEFLYLNKERDATMSILDIGLLTGFTVDNDDLNLLSKGPARVIDRYEMDSVLSERGSLIIYLNKVSHTQPEEITFRITQPAKVGILQPAAVSIYEYYDRTHCVKFYHPQRRAGQLLRLCKENECTCAEENCSMQKKGDISNDERLAKICESTETSKIEYAYKVSVENVDFDLSADSYTARVIEVIKEGTTDVGSLGKLRTFLGYQHCREALQLKQGRTYLVMGSSKDIHRDEQNESFQYVLGERTWIEYWPTSEECQSHEHRPSCLGLEEMVDQYNDFPCQQ
ncbi:complement C3 [Nothobranchius furzeri]|uniref:Complement component C3-1 n=2 Tax=Nothobranchius TaxID=28779 RepID=A0A1A8UQZ1_NOTFU